MPLPGGLTTITVTGTYTNPDGSAATGYVTFTPSVAVTDAAGKVIIPAATLTAGLAGGAFSIVLPCTDNAGLSPSGWQWHIVVNITGINGPQSVFTVNLPSTLGSTVDISALSPVAGVNPGPVSLLNSNNTWTGTNSFTTTSNTGYVQPGNGTAAGGHFYSGSGVPNIAASVAGDLYLRTDTPSTSGQRLYIATAGNTWTALTV